MARLMTDIPEFEASGRKVVLLTLKEAKALLEANKYSMGRDDDLGRAVRVLAHQVQWLTMRRNQGAHDA